MEITATTIIIALASVAVFTISGAWVASQKGRSRIEGALLAFLFGPVGLIIEACLPNWPGQKYRRHGPVQVVPEYREPEPLKKATDEHDKVADWLEP